MPAPLSSQATSCTARLPWIAQVYAKQHPQWRAILLPATQAKNCNLCTKACYFCCRLLQVGLLPLEEAKVEAAKLKNARYACVERCLGSFHGVLLQPSDHLRRVRKKTEDKDRQIAQALLEQCLQARTLLVLASCAMQSRQQSLLQLE